MCRACAAPIIRTFTPGTAVPAASGNVGNRLWSKEFPPTCRAAEGGVNVTTYVDRGGVELPAAPEQQGVVVVVRAGTGPVSGLDPHQGLEAAQCGRRLAAHRLPPDQRLQPHQTLERAQRPPRLHSE